MKGLNKAFIIIVIIIIIIIIIIFIIIIIITIIEYESDLQSIEYYLCQSENKHQCSALPTELRCLVTA